MDNTFLTRTAQAMMDCLGLMAIPMLLLGAYLLYQESKKIPPGSFIASDTNGALEYLDKMRYEATQRYIRESMDCDSQTSEW